MSENITKIDAKPPLIYKKRVCAYARVSSGKDAMLHSLSAQISYYSKLIQNHAEWIYVGVYADEAFTGTKEERPNFKKMIEDARSRKIDIIVVKSVSRFARNTVTLLETTRELKELGVDVFFEEQNIHTLTSEGELMLSLLASFAQEESRSTSENMKWRIKKDFSEGIIWGGKPHLGYALTNKRLIVIPEEAKIVKRIFSMYLNGYGTQKIANILNDEKVKPKFSNLWNRSTIRKILGNINYTGDLLLQKTFRENHMTKRTIINRGEQNQYLVEADHEAIIAKEDFKKVQELLEQNGKSQKESHKKASFSIFTRKIQCGNCGAFYKHKITKYNQVWNCSTFERIGKSHCPLSKQIPEIQLKETIKNALGWSEFCDDFFKNEVKLITAMEDNTLQIHMTDGTVVVTKWQDRNRADSWTNEMRELARERALKQHTARGVDGKWQK